MLIIYVKHYLTCEGIDYFNNVWFPKVQSIISLQSGFISIVHDQSKDKDDCVNIIVKFSDEKSVNLWVQHPSHDSLVDALDPYRSRNYWEAVRSIVEVVDTAKLGWQKIDPRSENIDLLKKTLS